MGNQLDKNEVLRYMGASHSDDALDLMIAQAEQEVIRVSAPKHLCKNCEITVSKNSVTIGNTVLESKDLAAHLEGCREAFLFACTLGPGPDTLMKRYTVTNMPMVPVLQACAAAYTELCADDAQEELEHYAKGHGLYLRPRYSPGYGDFPLSTQCFLFDALEISKKIGVSLTDGFLMVPFKSVTAVIGLSENPSLCHVEKCMTCSAKNCPFRKEPEHD